MTEKPKEETPHVHTEITPPVTIEDYEALRKENVTLKRQVQAYKMREKLPKPPTSQPPKQELPTPTSEEEKSPHFVGTWQQYCPTCGDKNPDFKDETICDPKTGGCGMHLGAVAQVEKLKACPNCGKTHARRL